MEKQMKIFLWEFSDSWAYLVLWDGENTYWIEEMRPSSGYERLLDKVNLIEDRARYTYIGEL